MAQAHLKDIFHALNPIVKAIKFLHFENPGMKRGYYLLAPIKLCGCIDSFYHTRHLIFDIGRVLYIFLTLFLVKKTKVTHQKI